MPLERFTNKTLTTLAALEEIETVKRQGYALDDEEFLPGLVCAAVLVPDTTPARTWASPFRHR
ncbi:MAG: IclR family transcriptional regulator C-terminal domain-containing protein [Rhodocyclaceae bacterium]